MARSKATPKLDVAGAMKALAHPLREEILDYIARTDGEPVSPSEMAEALGVPLANLSYHVRMLSQLGIVKVVKVVPRRGAIEHFYAYTSDEARDKINRLRSAVAA
jgi:DNA-binding transcriptional ArsR family regulator